jgi:hypothetical protein
LALPLEAGRVPAGEASGRLSMPLFKNLTLPPQALAIAIGRNLRSVRVSMIQVGQHPEKSLTNEAKRLLKTNEIVLLQIAKAKRYLKTKGLFL